MDFLTVLRANIKRHSGNIAGVFLLVLIVSVSLAAALSVWISAAEYIENENVRTGYGDITVWVSGNYDINTLMQEISAVNEVKSVANQSVIFTDYEANHTESDSEGQLIKYSPENNKYKFFRDVLSGYTGAPADINSGEVYVSPSMVSILNIGIDDTITFKIARNKGSVNMTVKGFYENTFMGSSMIGMKGFLISENDFDSISGIIADSGINALARTGDMLHIYSENNMNTSELNNIINSSTSLPEYTEFVHSRETINGFMLVLHNAFCGIVTAFAIVLMLAALAVLGHSISSGIEADMSDMGILKTIGFTSRKLRAIQLAGYFSGIIPAIILGIIFSVPLAKIIISETVTTTGVLIPVHIPAAECALAYAVLIFIAAFFIAVKTRRINKIPPIQAIQKNIYETDGIHPALNGEKLHLSLAVIQLFSGRRRYIGACAVAVMLTFFASLSGRVYSWLGADGKGMMDAFNPADHDIGVQSFGTLTNVEFEEVIRSYTGITDTYLLAMPNVSVNGVDLTANVITDQSRFHIITGNTCKNDNEIVITEFIAADIAVGIGDTVKVSSNNGSGDYIISGIYSCANDMGDNVGMSREGYLKIGRDNPNIWCYHYFLEDPALKYDITTRLEELYGGDIHVHENTWPGLFGIISAMQALVAFMYAAVVVFILTVTVMTSEKVIASEQRDLGIFKAMGFTDRQLRLDFAARFGITAIAGALIGTVLAALFTDPLVSAVMKLAGISNFYSSPNFFEVLFPAAVIILLYAVFGYISAGKIKKVDLTILISE